MSARIRVVVTGLGAVSPYGRGAGLLWESLVAGRSGIRDITLFDASPFRNPQAGEVPGYAAQDGATRAERFLVDAGAEAAAAAGLSTGSFDPARSGVIAGTNFGGMSAAEEALAPGAQTSDLTSYGFGHAAGALARAVGFCGERSVVSLSCASGTATILAAHRAIASGRADVMIAAGYDELSLYCYAGLSALRAVTKEKIRPFDANRSGTIFSEGAGCIVLEAMEHARARGARPLAEVLGGAVNNDGYHMTAPEKTGRGIKALLAAALADAGVSPPEIDHVNAHATATKYNDKIETEAIKHVLGPRAREITVTANKSMIGHAMGAAGSLEAISAVRSITEGVVPPTVNRETPDPECDLDCVPGAARECEVRTVLTTSYGMGGTNAAVLLREVRE